mmetsp:Transcript_42627/g.56267  ORF Transcript_42627/g.56267 Transcript_42627/m.56267 type:complete len:128 (-) Transcript_42627:120-503(-)
MPTQGSRRRGGAAAAAQELKKANSGTYDSDGIYTVPDGREPRISYPHKKYKTREQFLAYWETFFSKHWDTCCNWSFKNKYKMYGSIGFDSVLKAGKNREKRLSYFREIVDELKSYGKNAGQPELTTA